MQFRPLCNRKTDCNSSVSFEILEIMREQAPTLFLSHKLDSLVDCLLDEFDANPISPIETRTILVPNAQIKQWLLLEIAKRKKIAMGLKILEVNQAFEAGPNAVQMFCLIYRALLESTDPDLQKFLGGEARKQKRLLDLTDQLVSLFYTYGQFGKELFVEQAIPNIDWQHAILQKIFGEGPWALPVQQEFSFSGEVICFGIGAVLAGKLSKDRVEPGISCICGFFVGILLIALLFVSWSIALTICALFLLGIFGGAYVIPFDAFLQVNSPDEKRGQVIAASSFFSFTGVLLASFALYFISEFLGFTAAVGFAVIGVLTLISNTITTGRLSSLFFSFFVQKILKRFRKLKLASPMPDPSAIVILQSNSWYDAILLFSCFPNLKILVPDHYLRHFPWINGWMECIRIIPPEPDMRSTLVALFGQAKRFQGQNASVCLFLHKREDSAEIIEAYKKVFGRLKLEILFAHKEKESIRKSLLFFHYNQKQITLKFSKEPNV